MPPRDADEWGLPEGYDESDDFGIKRTPSMSRGLSFKGSAHPSLQKGYAGVVQQIQPGLRILPASIP